MKEISLMIGAMGLLLLLLRMWPRRKTGPKLKLLPSNWPKVSVIVPARNEEAMLGRLLDSLVALDYPELEVIVVDDCSTDRTFAVASSYPIRVLSGRERPDGWHGKHWACHQGAEAARGDYLLFTDADTVHAPESLRTAILELLASGSQGLTALPFHENPKFWERLSGPFYLLLLAATRPYGKAHPRQYFAIGQYLLFARSLYRSIGGHEAVRGIQAEDLALAKQVLLQGGDWQVHTGKPFYTVRMYGSLVEFVRGWRRNFRAGVQMGPPWAPIEMTLYIAALAGAGYWKDPIAWALMGLTVMSMVPMQRRLGRFSLLGPLLWPFSIGLFCLVTILALYDSVFRRPLVWKNRKYAHAP